MKINLKKLFLCIAIPLFVGALAGLISKNSINLFELENKPPLYPPSYIFPIVWTIIYILMGLASYIIVSKNNNQTKTKSAFRFYIIQLIFNFFWPIWFFNFNFYFFAFFWLIALLIFIILTTISFYKISKLASYLMIPYILWVIFAGYLNLSITILNS